MLVDLCYAKTERRFLVKQRSSFILAILILAYCVWNSLDLFQGWSNAPYERFSWLLFLIWCLPPLYYRVKNKSNGEALNKIYLWLALILSFLGALGNLNAVKYVGLACALASFMPWNPLLLIWFVGSSSWMPATGWLGSHYFSGYVFGLRLSILIAAMAAAAWAHHREHRGHGEEVKQDKQDR